MRAAIQRYRFAPEAYPGFGDWSPGLVGLDPFQDGHAGLRIGLYIAWVYEALKKGMTKQDALALASKQFQEQWERKNQAHGSKETVLGSSVLSVSEWPSRLKVE